MRVSASSTVAPGHPDYQELTFVRDAIAGRMGGLDTLHSAFPALIRAAIDFVIDPVLTGRNSILALDNVEKTFIGIKIEHAIRDLLDVPKGLRDLVIDGIDVDVKNTTRNTWMIPLEIYRIEGLCLLIASDEVCNKCWLGLIKARSAYLNAANQDKKRSVSAPAFAHILWIINGADYPANFWSGLDMLRFRELRKIKGGTKRAAIFFRENLGKVVHRSVLQALLFDQKDYMKRVRGNGGARDLFKAEGLELLSGASHAHVIASYGINSIGRDSFIAVDPLGLRS